MTNETYRATLDEISLARYDAAMAKAAAASPRKNEIVDAAGFGRLSQSDLDGLQGIAGEADDARIYHDLEIFGGITATLVLCDEALGLYYADANNDLHGYQMSDAPRLVRELVAAELAKWHERHHGVEIGQHVLDRLGFESVF